MNSQTAISNFRRSLFPLLAISFFLFICWVIYRADQGEPTFIAGFIRQFKHGDKAGHLILYGVLALLVNLALNHRTIKIFSYSILTGSFLVGTFAILEEFTQIALASRSFEVYDIICDLVGITLFSYLGLWFQKR